MELSRHTSTETVTSEQVLKNTLPQICITSMSISSMTPSKSILKTMANMNLETN